MLSIAPEMNVEFLFYLVDQYSNFIIRGNCSAKDRGRIISTGTSLSLMMLNEKRGISKPALFKGKF
jgi:hypothetical protein